MFEYSHGEVPNGVQSTELSTTPTPKRYFTTVVLLAK